MQELTVVKVVRNNGTFCNSNNKSKCESHTNNQKKYADRVVRL